MAVAHVEPTEDPPAPRRTSLEQFRPWFELLPLRRRQVVEMTVQGLSPQEVAHRIGKPFSSASARAALHAARGQLEALSRTPADKPQPPKPCGRCGELGHDGRQHAWDGRRKRVSLPPSGERKRSKTIGTNHHGAAAWNKLSGVDGRHHLPVLDGYPADVDRPQCRADCESMPRPCPFVSCSHHLYLDVNPQTGAIKLNFPHLEVWEMEETCSLDVADRGGITLEEVGAILNLTRERIRQVEVRGLSKIKDHGEGAIGLPEARGDGYSLRLPVRRGDR